MLVLSLKKFTSPFQMHYRRLSMLHDVVFESGSQFEVERISRIINDHPFPDQPLHHKLLQLLPPTVLSPSFVENVLGRLFATHSNGLKALDFFRFSLHHSSSVPSSGAFEKTLHILARMRHFDKAWELMVEIGKENPSLLTRKSMSIMLSKIAKFKSYDDTLEAFERMEKIFVGRSFGVEEFNVLLHAFCTQRKMKEAQSVFQMMYERFPPNGRTMNILLLGFKEFGDLTALELFYRDMVQRGFKPTASTYNIRIDAYCKKGHFGEGLRIFEEMDRINCLPTLETITTLIHGAGIARNTLQTKQLFDEIPKRNLEHDIGAYNALISSYVKCREVNSAFSLMDEMEEKHIGHDNVTYHTIFSGLMRSGDVEGVCVVYRRMIQKNFVPKSRTAVMLMQHFCVNDRLNMGLDLWHYLVDKGYCPHSHVLDLLVTGLCSRGRFEEALECSKQLLNKGRIVSEAIYRILERFSLHSDTKDEFRELLQKMKK